MSTEPCIEVWRVTKGVWGWLCNDDKHHSLVYGDRDYPTHEEALAAALNHCQKAGQP